MVRVCDKNIYSSYLEESLLDSDELDDLVLPDPVVHLQHRHVLLSLRLRQPSARAVLLLFTM